MRTFRALFAHEVGRRGSSLSKPIGGSRQTEGMAEEAFPGELWDIDQLAAHLKTSKDFVYTLTAQRRIGFLRVGKFIRFAPEHVRDYLNSIAVPAEVVHTGKGAAVSSHVAHAAEQTRAFPTAVRNVGGRIRTPHTQVAPKIFS